MWGALIADAERRVAFAAAQGLKVGIICGG